MPLPRAHAHNDYRHERPLHDALAHGFTGVEADIFLVDDDLVVAHDRHEITPERTLRRLYLDPLRERVKQNGGRVYPNSGAPGQVTLLIDIKSEAAATYKALDRILAEYQDIFTSFGPDGRRDRAVLAIISGNRPYELMASQKVRYAGYDGRLTDLQSDAPADLMPLISDNWTRHFKWRGTGRIPAEERTKLREIVQTAHDKGRRVRFWATPDNSSPAREALWRELILAGVDMLNTDDLEGLQQFLLAHRLR
jgi:glycerophosphoryl diester phosphodiesterase